MAAGRRTRSRRMGTRIPHRLASATDPTVASTAMRSSGRPRSGRVHRAGQARPIDPGSAGEVDGVVPTRDRRYRTLERPENRARVIAGSTASASSRSSLIDPRHRQPLTLPQERGNPTGHDRPDPDVDRSASVRASARATGVAVTLRAARFRHSGASAFLASPATLGLAVFSLVCVPDSDSFPPPALTVAQDFASAGMRPFFGDPPRVRSR